VLTAADSLAKIILPEPPVPAVQPKVMLLASNVDTVNEVGGSVGSVANVYCEFGLSLAVAVK
jgi:hypothetical protein